MPKLDGVGLYRELEKGHPELLRRIAFVTGTTESPDYSRFLKETAVPVLHKPFNLGDIERFVRVTSSSATDAATVNSPSRLPPKAIAGRGNDSPRPATPEGDPWDSLRSEGFNRNAARYG
jgi:DNA-binding response OmpR family regulator